MYLLQEAVRFCQPRVGCTHIAKLEELIAKNLTVNVLTQDAQLRGIEVAASNLALAEGSYETLVDLMTTCDRVVGVP